MSMEIHGDYKLLGTAVAGILNLSGCKMALINTDDMTAALLDVSEKCVCTVNDNFSGSSKPDFYKTAADSLNKQNADEIYNLCKDSKKSFRRYIQTSGASDEQLVEDVSCESLVKIYDDGYKQSVEELINAVKTKSGENVNIVVVGRLSVFYPVEHTIKKALTPMPFLPLDTLYVNDDLADTYELTEKGKAICEKIEREKKSICHNIMVQFKRLSGDELEDWLFVLAKKGDDFEVLTKPKYSEDVIVHALDPIVIFADSKRYTLNFPRALFENGNLTAKVQFALGIKDDIPKLVVKNHDKITMLDIDKKIYSEG